MKNILYQNRLDTHYKTTLPIPEDNSNLFLDKFISHAYRYKYLWRVFSNKFLLPITNSFQRADIDFQTMLNGMVNQFNAIKLILIPERW
jgi:hypothetical protein